MSPIIEKKVRRKLFSAAEREQGLMVCVRLEYRRPGMTAVSVGSGECSLAWHLLPSRAAFELFVGAVRTALNRLGARPVRRARRRAGRFGGWGHARLLPAACGAGAVKRYSTRAVARVASAIHFATPEGDACCGSLVYRVKTTRAPGQVTCKRCRAAMARAAADAPAAAAQLGWQHRCNVCGSAETLLRPCVCPWCAEGTMQREEQGHD